MARAKKEEKHEHLFLGVDQIEKRCDCGTKQIPLDEYYSRKREWEIYYSKVDDTKARKRFHVQKEAYLKGNLDLVKQFAQKAKEQLENNDFELKEPEFSDPTIEKIYSRLLIS